MDRESTVSRKVIPRWRQLSRTPSRELESQEKAVVPPHNANFATRYFHLLYQKWRTSPTLENATEVIDAALSVKDKQLAIGPARLVLKNKQIMPAVRAVAQYVITGPNYFELDTPQEHINREAITAHIRTLKRTLINDPRNALAWLDKSLLYTELGDLKSGEHAILRAFACAPENRFVLRGYSRFMVHRGAYDRAHDTLVRSCASRFDPWIQAAEISVAELAGRVPQTIRHARKSLEDGNFSNFHISELAAAIGTLEAAHGKRRLANKYFRRCLIDPTDNALSQAFWIRENGNIGFSVDESQLRMKGAAEARFLAAAYNGDWLTSAEAGEEWVHDEPFSLRATANGSFIASSFLSQHERAIHFCNVGLVANPGNMTLTNNKVVALCRSGQLAEASKLVPMLRSCKPDDNSYVAALATLGLHAFRSGNIREGRERYVASIEAADRQSENDARFRALFHWANEEIHAKTIRAEIKDHVIEKLNAMESKTDLGRITTQLWSFTKEQMKKEEMGDAQTTDVSSASLIATIEGKA